MHKAVCGYSLPSWKTFGRIDDSARKREKCNHPNPGMTSILIQAMERIQELI
jgi:hypothetical protein